MGSCPMEKIGECNGVTLYFADSRFERPGVYYWDGTDNVRAWPTEEPQPTAAASVSERARALLADEYERNGHLERAAIVRGQALHPDSLDAIHLRALEQALTQQRVAASYDAGMAMHWIERYAAGIDEECQLDRIAEAFTTPQPSADAVRDEPGDDPRVNDDSFTAAIRACRSQLGACRPDDDEPEEQWMWDKLTKLESLLSAASGEKGVG